MHGSQQVLHCVTLVTGISKVVNPVVLSEVCQTVVRILLLVRVLDKVRNIKEETN